MADNNLNPQGDPCGIYPKIAYGTVEYFSRLPESSPVQVIVPDGSVPTEKQWEFNVSTNPVMPKYTHCGHMGNALPRRATDEAIRESIALIQDRNVQFDTFAFRGISGTIFAPILAHLMNKEMILVRKDKGAHCASGRWVEGYKQAKRYILVDDLISSGDSAADTVLAVRAFTEDKAELVKILLYNDDVELLGVNDDSSKSSYASPRTVIKLAKDRWEMREHLGNRSDGVAIRW